MPADTEPLAEIPRERPDVRARAHGGAEHHFRQGRRHELDSVHHHRRLGELDRYAAPGQPITALPLHVLGRVLRRALALRAFERGHGIGHRGRIERRQIGRRSERGAGAIVGVGREPEPDRGEIRLGLRLDEPREPRRPPYQDNQETGRERIERPGVTHGARPERSPDSLHDVMGSRTGRLVHQKRTDQLGSSRRRPASSSLIRAACASPLSSSKCSSGTIRVESVRAARERRNLAAL